MTYYPPRYLLRRDALLRLLRPGQRFLEVGPGEYKLSLELARRFPRGMLVEFHPESRALYDAALPGAVRERVELRIGDFSRMDLDGAFDCVVACEVLEHVPDDDAFAARLAGCLRPGGQLLLSVPAHMRFWSPHDEAVGHLRRYEREPLVRLLEGAGFDDVRVLSYGLPWIHLFRLMRVAKQRLGGAERGPSDLERTQASGIHHLGEGWSWLGALVNPVTFWPLNLVARAFEGGDASDGYVVSATRRAADGG